MQLRRCELHLIKASYSRLPVLEEKGQLQVSGIHIPDARATCDKVAVVRVMDALTGAGTEEVGLGKAWTDCWG